MSTEANRTAVALLTAAGLDDNAVTFTELLGGMTVREAADVICALVGGYRGTVRAFADFVGVDADELLESTLSGVGAAWAGETS